MAWEGEERRQAQHVTEDRVSLMIEEAVSEALAKHETRMLTHIDVKFGQLHKLITDAFPNGDPHGHRMAHEAQIRSATDWSRLKTMLIEKLLSAGLLAGVVWLALVAWEAIKREMHK